MKGLSIVLIYLIWGRRHATLMGKALILGFGVVFLFTGFNKLSNQEVSDLFSLWIVMDGLFIGMVVNAIGVDLFRGPGSFNYHLEDSLDRLYGGATFIGLVMFAILLISEKNLARLWLHGLATAWLIIIIAVKVAGKSQQEFNKALLYGLLGIVVFAELLLVQ